MSELNMKRNKLTLLVFTLYLVGMGVEAQSYVDLYPIVEVNNYQLNILKQEVKASSLENRSTINLPDPQVNLSYMWGDENAPSDKRMLSVSQDFDLTTISGARRRLAKSKEASSEAYYRVEKQAILEKFSQNCIKWRYLTKQIEQRNTTATILSQLAESNQKRYASGELNILEFNKFQFSIAEFNTQIRLLELERENLYQQLCYSNGGILIDTTFLQYDFTPMPVDFATWLDSILVYIPEMRYYQQNKEVSSREEKLAQLSWLPHLSAGYQSEITDIEAMRGGTIGVSLPLWANKNKVQSQRSNSKIADLRYDEAQFRIKSELSMLYEQIVAMEELLSEYQNSIHSFSVLEHEAKAYRLGALSALDYLESTMRYIALYDDVLELEYLIQMKKLSLMILGRE